MNLDDAMLMDRGLFYELVHVPGGLVRIPDKPSRIVY
jgi:hypothetical protein